MILATRIITKFLIHNLSSLFSGYCLAICWVYDAMLTISHSLFIYFVDYRLGFFSVDIHMFFAALMMAYASLVPDLFTKKAVSMGTPPQERY